jgi:hypothetical protein
MTVVYGNPLFQTADPMCKYRVCNWGYYFDGAPLST